MNQPESTLPQADGRRGSDLPLRVVPEPREAVRLVVDELEVLLARARAEERPCVLGLATGGTMLAVYAELVRRVRDQGLDLSPLRSFNLDEYVGLAPGDARSFRAYMHTHLVEPAGLDPERVALPDGQLARQDPGAVAAAYERAIAAAGGLELQLLGLGRNGHIGFNEPGSPPDSRTRLVELASATVEDAASTFGGADQVPRTALTMGMATILEAKRLRVLAFGAGKAPAVAAAVRGARDPQWPCSFLAGHPDVQLFVDGAAAGQKG